MKQKTKKTKENGITLIALVITIIVMLILVGVTINLVATGGLFDYARQAVEETQNAIEYENYLATVDLEEYIKGGKKITPIDTATSCVGYYADFDGEEGIDGIIFADLAKGNTKSGQWKNTDGAYTIPQQTSGLKSYYIKDTNVEGAFGSKDVIAPIEGTSGLDRFYVMALADIGNYYWDSTANGGSFTIEGNTVTNLGTGKTNTKKIMDETTLDDNADNLWNKIKDEYEKGWFVPSRAEWSAFAEELQITDSNYPDYGLSGGYWSASQSNSSRAWNANFNGGCMTNYFVDIDYYVRLCTTF